ncbi:ABC transporter ATP-binding protein [Nocardiopsis deserti]|uniref:ABC transporter ATP-binding protein n=1 Tax=Nocardiopsis deserti TaxID=2605988 RepID=UPI001CC22C7F|nr:ABC transporter ATP-binding protein [Nocardiopsis deserti]
MRGESKDAGACYPFSGCSKELRRDDCCRRIGPQRLPRHVLRPLGPNGAGKTTTMRLITGQSRATSGTVEIFGHDMPQQSRHVRSLLGAVPQEDNLDTKLTVRQNLDVFARFSALPALQYRSAVEEALAAVRLTERADHQVETLSGDMRRRLLLARGILTAPRLLLLDEPTVGLDPQIRQDLWDVMETLRASGTTVLMSTHYIEEAERLADEVVESRCLAGSGGEGRESDSITLDTDHDRCELVVQLPDTGDDLGRLQAIVDGQLDGEHHLVVGLWTNADNDGGSSLIHAAAASASAPTRRGRFRSSVSDPVRTTRASSVPAPLRIIRAVTLPGRR